LQAQGLAHYHRWAFGSVRQLGAAAELAAQHLRWLAPHAGWAAEPTANASDAFLRVAQGCKTLILKLARAVNTGKPLDTVPALGAMAQDWALAQAGAATLAGAD
jgi:hypothetical protein